MKYAWVWKAIRRGRAPAATVMGFQFLRWKPKFLRHESKPRGVLPIWTVEEECMWSRWYFSTRFVIYIITSCINCPPALINNFFLFYFHREIISPSEKEIKILYQHFRNENWKLIKEKVLILFFHINIMKRNTFSKNGMSKEWRSNLFIYSILIKI